MSEQRAAPRRNPQVRWKKIGAAGILLNLTTGEYFEIDRNGMAIWARLDGKTTADRIAAALAQRHSVSPVRMKKDVTGFLATLKKRRLLS